MLCLLSIGFLIFQMQKKNQRLIKESTKEGRARVTAELDKKVLQDQVRALKKHNAQLSQRCRDEVKLKLKEHEERKASQEKVKTLGGRLSFLLNKMQSETVRLVGAQRMINSTFHGAKPSRRSQTRRPASGACAKADWYE